MTTGPVYFKNPANRRKSAGVWRPAENGNGHSRRFRIRTGPPHGRAQANRGQMAQDAHGRTQRRAFGERDGCFELPHVLADHRERRFDTPVWQHKAADNLSCQGLLDNWGCHAATRFSDRQSANFCTVKTPGFEVVRRAILAIVWYGTPEFLATTSQSPFCDCSPSITVSNSEVFISDSKDAPFMVHPSSHKWCDRESTITL